MVTQARRLRWDHFLMNKKSEFYMNKDSVEYLHILRFRQKNWKQIRDVLRREYRWGIAEGVEPHWVAPSGGAMLWQPVLTRQVKVNEDGERYAVFENPDDDWTPVGPITCNHAATLAQYLQKGFRLRPPQDGVEAEVRQLTAVESADPPKETPPEEDPDYICLRHGKDIFGFRTWDAYLQHCWLRKEMPEEEAPVEVIERLGAAPYACYIHNQTFRDEHMAAAHIRDKRCGNYPRPVLTTEQMKRKTKKDKE